MSQKRITTFDLNLARNARAMTTAKEIVALSLEERAQQREALTQKIQAGAANLFEEKVLVKLLEAREAERILEIQRRLPEIEAAIPEFIAASPSGSSSAASKTVSPNKPPELSDVYPSELLELLSSQKPPLSPQRNVPSERRSGKIPSQNKKPGIAWTLRDVMVILGCVGVFIFVTWSVTRQEAEQEFQTFDQQASSPGQQAGLSNQAFDQMQTEFNDALRMLRTGVFEDGKTRLLELIQTYPDTAEAENAYLAIADAYRQRQNNPDEALAYYQAALERYPQSSSVGLVQLKMGFAYEDLNDQKSAEQMYRLVLQTQGEKSRVGQLAVERLNALTP